MGLDASIRKRPESTTKEVHYWRKNEMFQSATEEVHYWRKNWVLQNWMDTENCVDRHINIETMTDLLDYILDEDNHQDSGSEGWEQDDWDAFADDIRKIIQDMEANETYIYTYDGWW